MTRPTQLVVNEPKMLALERKVLQSMITAIGHHNDRFRSARIDPDSVRTIQLAGCCTFPAPGSNVFGVRVVLMYPAQPITVGDVDVAIWRDRNIGRLVLIF